MRNTHSSIKTRSLQLDSHLLVREDEEDGVPEFVLVQHPIQLFLGLADSFPIVAVHDEDQSLRVLRREFMKYLTGKNVSDMLSH